MYRDILRNILHDPDLHAEFHEELGLTERMLDQQRHDKNKLYSIHAPEIKCIAKGKVHKKYEFGVKVSVATTSQDNFVVGMQALPGNPFDGHTLSGALDQVSRLKGIATTKRSGASDWSYEGRWEIRQKLAERKHRR